MSPTLTVQPVLILYTNNYYYYMHVHVHTVLFLKQVTFLYHIQTRQYSLICKRKHFKVICIMTMYITCNFICVCVWLTQNNMSVARGPPYFRRCTKSPVWLVSPSRILRTTFNICTCSNRSRATVNLPLEMAPWMSNSSTVRYTIGISRTRLSSCNIDNIPYTYIHMYIKYSHTCVLTWFTHHILICYGCIHLLK